jgi:hypothetical protein
MVTFPTPPEPKNEPDLSGGMLKHVRHLACIQYVMPPEFLLDILAMDLIDHDSLDLDAKTAATLRQYLHVVTRTRIRFMLVGFVPSARKNDVILEAIRARLQDVAAGRGAYK